MNILISEISSYRAIAISRFLKSRYKEITIIAFDSRKASRLFRTKYCDVLVPIQTTVDDGDAYVEEVSDLVKQYDIDVFLPIDSKENGLILQHKHRFQEALSFMGDYESFSILNDKARLHSLASASGINVPRRFTSFQEIRLPAVIKPNQASSAKGLRYLFDENDLELAQAEINDFQSCIAQEYVQGDGIGYSAFCRNGELENGFGHRRLAEFPVTGGSSVYRENFFSEEMHNIAAKIIAAAGWSGFAMFEFKLTASKEVYLIEVNPRIWGSVNQGLQNGVNFFESLISDSHASSVSDPRAFHTYLPPLVYISLMQYCLRGKFTPLIRFLSNLRSNRADVNLIDDLGGWLSLLRRGL